MSYGCTLVKVSLIGTTGSGLPSNVLFLNLVILNVNALDKGPREEVREGKLLHAFSVL